MSIRGTFSNPVDSAVINEFDERDVMQISTVFEDVYDVACRRVFSSGTF